MDISFRAGALLNFLTFTFFGVLLCHPIIYVQTSGIPNDHLFKALDFLREHYHPTMLNNPDGIVYAKIEFNLAAAKKDK